MAGQAPNVCAGPFGALCDFYIERPWLMRALGRLVWGIDAAILYRSMQPIVRAPAGSTIADVPCGGGVDLFLSFSGLHMVAAPERAVTEMARCLRPGGELVGTTFLADSSRRARALFRLGGHRGHLMPPSRADLLGWLRAAGFENAAIGPEAGFAAFTGRANWAEEGRPGSGQTRPDR